MNMGLMNAAMYYAPLDVRFERVPIPRPGPGEVLVRIQAALTCGTDIKAYQRGHPAMLKKVPTTFGHEFSGDIVEVGQGVGHLKVGDRVVACNAVPCGQCFYCKMRQQNLCDNLLVLNGAYAEYIIVPAPLTALNLLRVPDHLSYHEVAIAEPLGTAIHAVDLTDIRLGDTVAVIGVGPLGLMIIRLAVLQGARVIAIGKGDERLAKARQFGAAEIVDIAREADPVATVRALTEDERGADVVIEAVGKPEAWEEALKLVRKGGTVTFFGGCKTGTTITVDTYQLHYQEVKLLGTFHQTPRDFKRAVDLLSARLVDGREFVKETLPLSQLLQAFERVKQLQAIKYAIDPTQM